MRTKTLLLASAAAAVLAVAACGGATPPATAQPTAAATTAGAPASTPGSMSPASIEPVPFEPALPSTPSAHTSSAVLRASQAVGRLQAKDPDHWGGQYAAGNTLVVYTALGRDRARQALNKAGLGRAPIDLRVSPVTLTRLQTAGDLALDAASNVRVNWTVNVGPQYGAPGGPRIVVGLPQDNLSLREALARIQLNTGVPIVTYYAGSASGPTPTALGPASSATPAPPSDAPGSPAEPHEDPDLIPVRATNGRMGYVKKSEVDAATGANIATPADALAWQADMDKRAATGEHLSVPVYDADGHAVIGQFPIDISHVEPPAR